MPICLTLGCGGNSTVLPAAPQANLNPPAVSFANTEVGASSTAATVTLTNSGGQPLDVTNASLSDQRNFALATTCPAVLAPGAACSYAITFQPAAAQAFTATLVLTDTSGGASGTQQTINLSGTGLPVPEPLATVAPATLTFASSPIGVSAAPQTVTLSNTGTAPLQPSTPVLSDPTDFNLSASTCTDTLAPGASCTYTLLFVPQVAGTLQGTLTLTDNSGGVPGTQQKVGLTGLGLAPPAAQASLTPAMLTFPDTMLTQSSSAVFVTLANTGGFALTLGSVALSDTENFSLYNSCPTQLAPGASCVLSLDFHPETIQTYSATLTVTDNSGASSAAAPVNVQQTAQITAKGIAYSGPSAAVTPASLNFAQTITDASAPAQPVTLTNTGTSALTVSRVALNGAAASSFNLVSDACTGSLAAGASCSISVGYSPKLESTADTASLVITDDSLGVAGSTQTVLLSGSALAKVASVENFGDSITCGFYAQPHDGTGNVYSQEGYAGLFDAALGVPAQNWCRQGDTAADMARQWVFSNSSPTRAGHQLFTLMIGTNDAYRYGIPSAALQTYTAEVGAALSWLTLPDTDKVLANAITQQTGPWSADVGFGLQSTTAGASLSFPVNQAVAGHNLYLVYHVWNLPPGQAGKAEIAIDGTVVSTVDESTEAQAYLPTENGTTDTYLLLTVPLGAVGQHTVTFTSAGPDGSLVGLLWAGVPQADYHTVDGAPRVMLGLITNSPSGNQTFVADIYNQQLANLAPALNADGLQVTLVPTDRVLDVLTDFVDILHPNNSGHAKLAAQFGQSR